MFSSLRLSDLSSARCHVLRHADSTRPMIWAVEEGNVRAVVKDFSQTGFLFRHVVGRFLVWREHKALRKLQGLKGVPRVYRVIDGLALVVERIPGRVLEDVRNPGELPDAFFENLESLVEQVHERGVAHCDLKRAANILIDPEGHPHFIDWGASISRDEFRLPPFRRVYERFLDDDHLAVTKRKLIYVPDSVSSEERARYEHRSGAERLLRTLRDRLREMLQKLA